MQEPKEKNPGLIHIYCGDGKGKTTAAIGLILRSAGHGRRIMLVQFLKNGQSGELIPLRQLPDVRILTGPANTRFTNEMDDAEKAAALALHVSQLAAAALAARQGEMDLLVLDEALDAIETGLLPEKQVLELLRTKPAALEIVLTGRQAQAEILDLADYISEIHGIRHPWQKGVPAREGIEY